MKMGSSEIMGLPTKEEWMNDRQARAMAIERVQGQAWTEGKRPTVRELLDLAHEEMQRYYERLQREAELGEMRSLPDAR